jgi:glycosyltransferase involved in cell wall biosynthesis
MIRVFHLVGTLGPIAAAKQLSLIAPALPRDRFTQIVGLLGPGEPFANVLTASGVELIRLPIRHAIDMPRLVAMQQAIAAMRPDVIHAWGPLAARVAFLLGRPAAVVSGCGVIETGLAGWLTRRALHAARAVTAMTQAEADRIRESANVSATIIPPAVACVTPQPDPAVFRKSLGLPESARLIITAGGFDTNSGELTAVWSFDILKYADPTVHLVLFGDGPDRKRIARFSKSIGFDDDRVRFAGPWADVAAAVGLAEVAWVTHRRGGVNLALEAMAAAVPVIAVHNRDLSEILEDDVTGKLVPAGDRIRLAAVTNDLLNAQEERIRLGKAGQAAVVGRFAPVAVVERYAALYDDVKTLSRSLAPTYQISPGGRDAAGRADRNSGRW